jgi:hypothetical protein
LDWIASFPSFSPFCKSAIFLLRSC